MISCEFLQLSLSSPPGLTLVLTPLFLLSYIITNMGSTSSKPEAQYNSRPVQPAMSTMPPPPQVYTAPLPTAEQPSQGKKRKGAKNFGLLSMLVQ